MLKIMILGGEGMLGYALRQIFSFEKVVCLGHKTCDISDQYQLARSIGYLQPDYVLNCAAYTDVDAAESSQFTCELINASAMKFVAEQCSKNGAVLVHFSTEMVFGQEDGEGYDEFHKPQSPVNVYGRCKLEGEQHVLKLAEKHYIVRTSWMFGPNGNNFVDKILRIARQDNEVTVVDDQWGCPTYTFDLARAVYQLILDRAPYGVYHLTNSGPVPRSTFAKRILALAGKMAIVNPKSSHSVVTLARRPRQGILKNTKRPELRRWEPALHEYLVGIGETKDVSALKIFQKS